MKKKVSLSCSYIILKSYADIFFPLTLHCCLQLPSRFPVLLEQPQPDRKLPLLPVYLLSHVTQQFFFFLLCSVGETVKTFVVNSAERNVLLNVLCLLTSLSCQFFCSAFVVAKDLCASSFVSNLRCQRCPFDVECRPHIRHHLCSSYAAWWRFSVLAYSMCE